MDCQRHDVPQIHFVKFEFYFNTSSIYISLPCFNIAEQDNVCDICLGIVSGHGRTEPRSSLASPRHICPLSRTLDVTLHIAFCGEMLTRLWKSCVHNCQRVWEPRAVGAGKTGPSQIKFRLLFLRKCGSCFHQHQKIFSMKAWI